VHRLPRDACGRKLDSNDFTCCPLNIGKMLFGSERLKDRLAVRAVVSALRAHVSWIAFDDHDGAVVGLRRRRRRARSGHPPQ
jgi:hypothetical protein